MFASIHNLPPDELYQKAIIFKEAEDYDNYIIHMTMAANLNHPMATEYLYDDFRNGHTYEKQDYSKTKNFYETTIEYGFSANYLAWMFEHGLGVPQDFDKSIELYQMAIQKGNSAAMINLALNYQIGRGVSKDFNKAIELYDMAIEKGNSSAMFILACLHKRGQNVPKDYKKAVSLYQMAVDKGHSIAMNNLAYMYSYGKGVQKDYNKTIKLYQMAFDNGHMDGMFNLGYLYEKGKGVSQDYNLMKKYYLMVIENGHSRAKERLKSYYKSNQNDLSIIELYDNKHFHDAAKDVINTIFQNNLNLPEQYKQQFANLRFPTDVHETVKTKQNILKKTNIWPSYYNSKYLLEFTELLLISSSSNKCLTKDVILYIAGCLFV